MPPTSDQQAVLDTIVALAEQIARTSPESAEQAMQIAELAGQLAPSPDRDLIKDAIDAETVDSDVSDARVQTAADAVMKATRADQ